MKDETFQFVLMWLVGTILALSILAAIGSRLAKIEDRIDRLEQKGVK